MDDELEETTKTKYTPLQQGLSHQVTTDEDGDIISESVGQHSGDDRVSPYSSAREINEDPYETVTEHCDVEGLTLFDMSFPIQNAIRENFTEAPFPIIGLTEEQINSVDTAKGHGRLKQITEDIKWLNRRTQETVTFSLYNFPHLIDFNDRILLNGAEYFLVANSASSKPRVFNEQNLTLRRWF